MSSLRLSGSLPTGRAEKYLKALLALHGEPAGKTHDLEALVAAAAKLSPPPGGVIAEAKHLADYAVDSRYPDAPFDFTKELAQQAEQHASRIKSAVMLAAAAFLKEG